MDFVCLNPDCGTRYTFDSPAEAVLMRMEAGVIDTCPDYGWKPDPTQKENMIAVARGFIANKPA
jgi:hypothetical protein